jgi:heme-binding NEAT domain protein
VPLCVTGPKPGTRNPKPETRNLKPETRDPKSETRNPRPETRDSKPETRNPKQTDTVKLWAKDTWSKSTSLISVNTLSSSQPPSFKSTFSKDGHMATSWNRHPVGTYSRTMPRLPRRT